ncbi:MAG: transcriptional regulator, partial [Prevotellaceae bacterium]|nr:transcriptional regulator [Prevotellaceae bacterium]
MAEESLIQIGQRLRGLREVLDIPAGDIAQLCGFTLETY